MRADGTPVSVKGSGVRPTPIRPEIRVVIVTIDNHLAGAVERAQQRLALSVPGLTIGFHAAADWEPNPARLEAARADVARADIVIATMLFLEDHIRAILPALQARQEACDAMVCLMSAAEVVRLTRIGSYRMDAPAKGVMALLKKLRGQSKPGANAGAKQMNMLRKLPKILRFIPGPAQDVRAYFLTLQYWLAGSDENVEAMVRALVDRYAAGDRLALKGHVPADAPREYPEVGVYHPAMADRISARAEDLPAHPGNAGTVGLLLLRSYVLGHDAGHYDGVIKAFEARGLKVIPAFASGLDSRPAIDAFFVKDGKPVIDALVSLTGFSLVGGPAYNDSEAAAAALAALDLPYLAAHPLEFQTLQAWGASRQGLLPLESTIMIAIPEIDGGTSPTIFGGRSESSGEACSGCDRRCVFPASALTRAMHSCIERAEMLGDRVVKIVALRRAERAERRIAMVMFNFPPNGGGVGTAANLAVFESAWNTLVRMKAEGYTVDLPADEAAFKDAIMGGNSARYGTDAHVHARVETDTLVRTEPHLAEIEAVWGAAPGKNLTDGSAVFILGQRFGNVFVGLQPPFGYEGDPMRMLFEGTFAPTHAFAAFYRWLRNDFAAHAVLHFGTHGALEFMPGKQAGLTGACWPDRLIGDLPNLYLYAANNPSEAAIAKRRSAATMISYLTPSLAEAGLYKGLLDLKASIERWRALLPSEDAERDDLAPLIQEQAAALDLVKLDPAWGRASEAEIWALTTRVLEVEAELIPHGLHIVGKGASPDERADMMKAMTGDMPAAERARIDALLAEDHELPAIIRALDGRFVPPVAGGDLIHNPDILPTGRNVHGFDPFRLPSAFAVSQGAKQAQQLLDRHASDGLPFPESVALVLWGTDNLKSEGAQIGQALALMGARPRFDSYGRLAGAELIPLAELGRPRVDVVTTLSGIFRDLLPLQTRMLAEAAWLATTADEPEALNFVRKHSLAHQAKHGCDLDTAALRVFSNAEGAYGANVNILIDSGAWTDPAEIADTYEARKGFAYGRTGAPTRQAKLLESTLATVDLAYQNLESVELGVTSIDHYVDTLGGISKSIERARGKPAPVYIADATQGSSKVRTLAEQVALESRTRALNPKWTEGMLRHGYEGVRQIESHVTNTMGWSATTGAVEPWVYQRLTETYVLDETMRDRLATLNPRAAMRVSNRLLEAHERNYWQPDAATLAALHAASDDLEDRLEGITAVAA